MSVKTHAVALATVLAAITAIAGPALAQSAKAWSQCEDTSPDISIRGCTAVIKAGKDTKKDLAGAFMNRGNAYSSKGQHDRAIQDYDQATRLNPNFGPAFMNRGIAYINKKQYDRAIQDYDQAIRLNPNYTSAFINRGVAYYNKGQYDRAIQDYDQAIRLDPKNALAFTNRGHAYAKKNQIDRAKQD